MEVVVTSQSRKSHLRNLLIYTTSPYTQYLKRIAKQEFAVRFSFYNNNNNNNKYRVFFIANSRYEVVDIQN